MTLPKYNLYIHTNCSVLVLACLVLTVVLIVKCASCKMFSATASDRPVKKKFDFKKVIQSKTPTSSNNVELPRPVFNVTKENKDSNLMPIIKTTLKNKSPDLKKLTAKKHVDSDGLKKFIEKRTSLLTTKKDKVEDYSEVKYLVSDRTADLVSISKGIAKKELNKKNSKLLLTRRTSSDEFDDMCKPSQLLNASKHSQSQSNELKLKISKTTSKQLSDKQNVSSNLISNNMTKLVTSKLETSKWFNEPINGSINKNKSLMNEEHTAKENDLASTAGTSKSKSSTDAINKPKNKFVFKKASNTVVTSLDDLDNDTNRKRINTEVQSSPLNKDKNKLTEQLPSPCSAVAAPQSLNDSIISITSGDSNNSSNETRNFGEPECSKLKESFTSGVPDSPKKEWNNSIEDYDKFLIENIDWESECFDDDDEIPAAILEESRQLSQASQQEKIDYSQVEVTSTDEPVFVASTSTGLAKNVPQRKDDTAEFRKDYPYTETMNEVLHVKFGLKSYRPHQQEIINASLAQYDCFVLMPTGGGKSLCYQLPAVLTPGVTVVISPLKALIADQVDKLNALDIPAAHMCADVAKAEIEQTMMKLAQKEPSLKLLYLTPEKIVASRQTCDMLRGLYQRGKLARFVIDEVHCLSHWGHDFRPDYKRLSTLRKEYPTVPMMCLTATATNLVQQDVLSILNLKLVKTFIRSFNRPNIKYKVFQKRSKLVVEDIANLIKSKFNRKSGIIYCLCRKDCDTLAKDLTKLGVKAKSYHAGMSDKSRTNVQREWMNDQFHVIVATIAFGMGIDKPDVRFVIHNSVPKSVEAFYQESGRGGRDGEVAYSYLFYSYSDVIRLQRLIRMDRNCTKATLEGHFDSLQQMAQYCENTIDCRRYLQLLHLGEQFDRKTCISNKSTTCDNCENRTNNKVMDVTTEARHLAQLVKEIGSRDNYTMLHFVDIYKGSKIKKILDRRHDKHRFHGSGAHLNKNDIHRVLKEMKFKNVVTDFCTFNGEFPTVYVKPGANYTQLFEDNMKLTITVEKNTMKPAELTSAAPASSSSPAASSSSNVAPTVGDDAYKASSLRVKCHEDLLQACNEFALERCTMLSNIMNLSALKTMSERLPKTEAEFLNIQYVTKANFDKFGAALLRITKSYAEQMAKLKLTEPKLTRGDSFAENHDWTYEPSFTSSPSRKQGTKRKRFFRRGGSKRGRSSSRGKRKKS